jgi:hypothetical protein
MSCSVVIRTFSEQQLLAAHEAIDHFTSSRTNWVILLAQMQSGKTETFLLIACELVRLKYVESIVIFSGNAETELCSQLNDTSEKANSTFWRKYKRFIGDDDLYEDIQDSIIGGKKINIVWGTHKKTYSGPKENSLFIWEEAHYAQNKGQGPDKFITKLGISADGDQEILQRKNNFVLTVSATPFSELSDTFHLDQNKKVVKMQPGTGYTGVKDIRDSGRIISWKKMEDGLNEALSLERNGYKYAIVRVTNNSDKVKEIISSKGWEFVEYDSSIPLAERKKGTCRDPGYLAWTSMNNREAPTKNIVILIKGMCRMGKNIAKDHLLFAFESSKSPESDTILQGLLGRVCGYGHNNVKVYLSSKVVDSKDIDRYIELWDNAGVTVMPKNAKNLVNSPECSDKKDIIPLSIVVDRKCYNNHAKIKEYVKDSLANHPERFTNKNSNEEFNEIKNACADNTKILHAFAFKNGTSTRNSDKLQTIKNAFNNNQNKHVGTEDEVNIWFMKDCDENKVNGVIPGFETVYVTATVINTNYSSICKTTKKEVFAHNLEDGTKIVCNGGMPKLLSPETATEWKVMRDKLADFVEVSYNEDYFKGVVSFGSDPNGEPCGIYVNEKVFKELSDGGRIFKFIKLMGATLKIRKSRRQRNIDGLIELSSIQWSFDN